MEFAVDQQSDAVQRAGLMSRPAGKLSYQVFLTGCSTLCQRTAALQCCYVHSYLACYTNQVLAQGVKLVAGAPARGRHCEGRHTAGSIGPGAEGMDVHQLFCGLG